MGYERVDEGLFPLGETIATPRALEFLGDTGIEPHELLYRHRTGDWGDVSERYASENDLAVLEGHRILSAYPIDVGYGEERQVWVITEADRSATTILLPDES